MALNYNSIKVLLYSKNSGVSLDNVLTLGRLVLYCPKPMLKKAVNKYRLSISAEELDQCLKEPYVDKFLSLIGCKQVTAIDYSNYEGATILHDFNTPIPQSLKNKYDVVLDAGMLEHVFNFPIAIKNCLEMVKPGGHFIATGMPTNSLVGHGFYQFSPELMFRAFSKANGFEMKKLILYKELKKDSPFYEVKDPAVAKQRVELQSWNPIAMALLAQKIAEVPAILSIQQSDYVVAWSNTGNWTTHVNRFMKFHRYLPSWTHRWMHRFSYIRTYGFRGLSNKRVYRKVTL